MKIIPTRCQRCQATPALARMLFRLPGRTLGPWAVCHTCVASGLRWLEREAGVPKPVEDDITKPIGD